MLLLQVKVIESAGLHWKVLRNLAKLKNSLKAFPKSLSKDLESVESNKQLA